MKRSFFPAIIIAILFLLPTPSPAQMPHPAKLVPKVDFGIKFGGNYDNINGNGWSNTYQTGYNGGIFLGVREHIFGIQGEALIGSGRYIFNGVTVKNLYLHVPVLFQIRLVPRLWLQVGPQYSFLLSSKYASNDNATNYFKPGGVSGVAGLQLLLPLHLTLGARYSFGLTDWDNLSKNNTWTIRAMQLYVGFRLL